MKLTATLLAATVLCSAGAAEAAGFRFDGGGTVVTETDTFAITGRASFEFPIAPTFYVAPEGEVQFGLFGDEGNLETDRIFGGFARAGWKLGAVDLHARAGYQSIQFEIDTPGGDIEFDDGDFAWGVGGTYWFSDDWGLRGDYTRSQGIDQVGVTASYRF